MALQSDLKNIQKEKKMKQRNWKKVRHEEMCNLNQPDESYYLIMRLHTPIILAFVWEPFKPWANEASCLPYGWGCCCRLLMNGENKTRWTWLVFGSNRLLMPWFRTQLPGSLSYLFSFPRMPRFLILCPAQWDPGYREAQNSGDQVGELDLRTHPQWGLMDLAEETGILLWKWGGEEGAQLCASSNC